MSMKITKIIETFCLWFIEMWYAIIPGEWENAIEMQFIETRPL